MPSPKPKPKALSLVDGSAKKHPERVNHAEPEPRAGVGDPPESMSARARELWCEVSESVWWLSDSDRKAFERYCTAEADSEWFYTQCEVEGWWVEGSRGTLVRHPASYLYKEACDRADKLATEFGMTPSSRTRGKAPSKPSGNDPLANRPGG